MQFRAAFLGGSSVLSDPREEIERCRGRTCRHDFATAAEAGRARQDFLDEQEATPPSAVAGLTVTELVTRYLDDYEATERLSPKSLFDYRHYLDDYITPWIGSRLVREIDAETIASWQVNLADRRRQEEGEGSVAQHHSPGPGTAERRIQRHCFHGSAPGEPAPGRATTEGPQGSPEALVPRAGPPLPRPVRG